MTIEIYRKCERCSGDGEIPAGEGVGTCPDCDGRGKMLFAVSDDLEDALNDILDKCNDILEAVQGT